MSDWMSGYKSSNPQKPLQENSEERSQVRPEPVENSGCTEKPNQQEKKNQENFSTHQTKNESFNDLSDPVWMHRLEFFCGVLMVVGLFLSLFYLNIGGALVGLSVGMAFYKLLYKAFNRARAFYSHEGVFKSAMLVGVTIFLLIAIPVFVLSTAIGFGVMAFIRSRTSHKGI